MGSNFAVFKSAILEVNHIMDNLPPKRRYIEDEVLAVFQATITLISNPVGYTARRTLLSIFYLVNAFHINDMYESISGFATPTSLKHLALCSLRRGYRF